MLHRIIGQGHRSPAALREGHEVLTGIVHHESDYGDIRGPNKGKGWRRSEGVDAARGQGTHPPAYYDRQWGRMFPLLDSIAGGVQLMKLVNLIQKGRHSN